MHQWTSGYVADVDYTFGYYPELNPLRVAFALLSAGLIPPRIQTACELGFGQGVSINIHASAAPISWYGNDFNPSQAGFAQDVADSLGHNALLTDDSFAEFVAREDLPEFDFIALHGIWTWISEENRTHVVNFIRNKLKVGGVLYLSYNTLPGWAAFAPVRQLLSLHAATLTAKGAGITQRIDSALAFTEALFDLKPLYTQHNTLVPGRLQTVRQLNKHYLAHEYFNQSWDPVYFDTMARALAPAKLSYACSAHYLDRVDAINLSAEQQQFLAAIPDRVMREVARDFMQNQQFRRDYWVKGARKISAAEQLEALRELRVVLHSRREAVTLQVTGSLGEATMAAAIYEPVLDILQDHQVCGFRDLEQQLAGKGITTAQLMEVITVLVGKGNLSFAQDEATIAKVRQGTDRFNRLALRQARSNADLNYLASPVTGGAHSVNRFVQLFLSSYLNGRKDPQDWASEAWELLRLQGQQLLKEGVPLEGDAANLHELLIQARQFAADDLGIFKALQIV